MITKGDSDFRHALEVLMDRGKYNDLDMLRAAHILINNIAYPKSGERDQSILPTPNKAELMEIAQLLESFESWVKLGEISATINITSDLKDD